MQLSEDILITYLSDVPILMFARFLWKFYLYPVRFGIYARKLDSPIAKGTLSVRKRNDKSFKI